MALTPRIAGTNLAPSATGRFAVNSAVANIDATPLTELNQINALIYEGQSEFQYDQFNPRQEQLPQRHDQPELARRRTFDRFGRPFEQTPERPINTPLLINSTESFAAAFDSANQTQTQTTADRARPQPVETLDNIITTYESTAAVIYDEVPPRGDNLSLTL